MLESGLQPRASSGLFQTVESARNILPSVYRADSSGEDREFDLILSYWTVAVGRLVAQHARPVYFGRGRLTVETDGPQWLAQLEAIAIDVRRRLNQELQSPLVKFILFRTAGARGFEPPRKGPGRATSASAAVAHPIRNPIRRRIYADSQKAAGE